jgi:2-phospho-L-lactate guanylyltransferase (CobY/MobA/RfbA family)
MTDRWVGITVSGSEVTLVDLEVPAKGPLTVQADRSIKVDKAENRAVAYETVYRRVEQYLREHKIKHVVVKDSATIQQKANMALLRAAELRGVVVAGAAAGGASVEFAAKAQLSKSFGTRKVDEYLKDEPFWVGNIGGDLRRGSREAAFVVLAKVRPQDDET